MSLASLAHFQVLLLLRSRNPDSRFEHLALALPCPPRKQLPCPCRNVLKEILPLPPDVFSSPNQKKTKFWHICLRGGFSNNLFFIGCTSTTFTRLGFVVDHQKSSHLSPFDDSCHCGRCFGIDVLRPWND